MLKDFNAALSQSSNSTVTLPGGGTFLVISPYTVGQSHAVIALVFVSCVSLIAVVGLLSAIAISAFNTRTVKNSNLFVRTHSVYYLLCLLLSDLFQAIGSIINSAWVNNRAILYGSRCTAQGSIKHMADVGIAIWSLVIAIRTFWILFVRVTPKQHEMWVTLIGYWSLFVVIVASGPAMATDKHGPFYGISGDWCWISPNYGALRITLDYMVMFISALLAFILYLLVFLKLRGIVRAQAPPMTVAEAAQERNEQFEHKLARQMLLYPIAYTILILPIAICRFSEWAGHNVSVAATVFSDFIYLLSGLVHVILFVSSRRILPPRSMIPKFLISNPSVITSKTPIDEEFDNYYNDAGSIHPWYPPTPPNGKSSATVTEARDLFTDPKQHPNEHSEAAIAHVRSPDSEYSSSSRCSLSEAGEMREVALSPASQWSSAPDESDGDELAEEEMIPPAHTHHEGEVMERPHTPPPNSALRHH